MSHISMHLHNIEPSPRHGFIFQAVAGAGASALLDPSTNQITILAADDGERQRVESAVLAIEPAILFLPATAPSLRPLAGVPAAALLEDDYRPELFHAAFHVLTAPNVYPTTRQETTDRRGPRTLEKDDWRDKDAREKAYKFLSDVRYILGGWWQDVNPFMATMALQGKTRVEISGPAPAMTAVQQKPAEQRARTKSLRLVTLYMDALRPALEIIDAAKTDGARLDTAALARALEGIRTTTSRLERLRARFRILAPAMASAREIRRGPSLSLPAQRRWLHDFRVLMAQGRYQDAYDLVANLPSDWRVIGKKGTSFNLGYERALRAARYALTGEPVWNEHYIDWNFIVHTRGYGR